MCQSSSSSASSQDPAPQTPAQVRAFFAAHRTIRRYQTQPDGAPLRLSAEELDTVLYAAQRAPTDATAQLYSIIHLENPALRQQIAEYTLNAHITSASEAFVLCADVWRVKAFLKAHDYDIGQWPHIGVHFGLGDAVLAGQNLLLAAEMLGYQGCWIGGVVNSPQEISQLLKLPAGVLPFAALTIGKPAEEPAQRPRLPRHLVVHVDQYQQPNQTELCQAATLMNPIAARPNQEGDWVRLLNGYFGQKHSMEKREHLLKETLQQQMLGEEPSEEETTS